MAKEEEFKKSQKHVEKIEKEKQGLKVEIQSSLIALQHTKSELHEIRDESVKLTKTLRVRHTRLRRVVKQLNIHYRTAIQRLKN